MGKWNLLPLDGPAIEEIEEKGCTRKVLSCCSPAWGISASMLIATTIVSGQHAFVVMDGALEPTQEGDGRSDLMRSLQEEWDCTDSIAVAFETPLKKHTTKAVELLNGSPVYFYSKSPIAALAVEQLDVYPIGSAGNAVVQAILYRLWNRA